MLVQRLNDSLLMIIKAAVAGNWVYIIGGDVAYDDDDGPVGRGKFNQGV